LWTAKQQRQWWTTINDIEVENEPSTCQFLSKLLASEMWKQYNQSSTTTTTTIITQEMIHLWWTSPVSNGWLWQEDCTVHSQ